MREYLGTEDVKLCPFCGGEACLFRIIEENQYYCMCLNCGAKNHVQDTEREAMRTWNRRVDHDE